MAWAGNATGRPPFWFGQGFGEIADPEAQPAWRDLEIGTIAIKGTAHRVSEQRRILSPFATLTEIDCEGRRPLAKCLVVMPQSGHFSLILRDLITGLLSDNDVIILDGTNARHIPLTAGEFGFDDTISTIVSVLRSLESSVHLIGVCQCFPVAATFGVGVGLLIAVIPVLLVGCILQEGFTALSTGTC